jgi:hypothetical protein
MQYNLFFAFTPLHLKIINSIPKKGNSILIILSNNNLDKFCNSYIDVDSFCHIHTYQAKFFNPIELIKINFRYKKINRIYIGNFKFFNFRLIDFFINYRDLITFDDGVGGVTGAYFNLNNTSMKERAYRIFNLDIGTIIKKHKFHYGIYNLNSNIFNNNIKSLILDNIDKKFNYNGNVLLTTDKSEAGTLSQEDERELLEKIIKNLNIKYILHHPSKKFNINILDTKIIDEPYLSDDIVCNSSFNHVYSLSASSVLGVIQLDFFPEKYITYLANKDAPVMIMLRLHTNINCINFEDL